MNPPATAGTAAPIGGLPLNLRRFLGYALLLFVLAGSLPERFLAPLNTLTATLAGWCLGLLGREVRVAGDLLALGGFQVRIISECTPCTPCCCWLRSSAPSRPGPGDGCRD